MIRRRIQIVTLTLASLAILPALAEDIKTQTVQSAVYDRYVSLGGTVIPFKEVTITAQQAGQVNYIAGVEGDQFEAGSLIISTDDDILIAQRNAAMAQWNQAAYAYQNATTQYNREIWSPKTEQSMPGMALPGLMDQMMTVPLSNTMGIGDRTVDRRANQANALSKVNEAKAQMHQIKSRIDEIDVRLSDTKSLAPFNGVIVKKMVEAGDTVQPGQPLLIFAKNNHLSVEVNVPVNLMIGIQKGAIFNARLANKRPIQVRVAQIFPVANSQQHTVIVKFDLPSGAPAAPGMYAEVSVKNASSQNQSFPIIPKSAIVKRGSLPMVFTVNEKNNKVEMKIVRVGNASQNGQYIVLSGIKASERIIVNPPTNIISGWVLNNGKLSPPKKTDQEL